VPFQIRSGGGKAVDRRSARAVVINFILLRNVLQVSWFALCILLRIMINSETMSLNTFKDLIRHSINTDRFSNTTKYRERFEPICCMFRSPSNADIPADVVCG